MAADAIGVSSARSEREQRWQRRRVPLALTAAVSGVAMVAGTFATWVPDEGLSGWRLWTIFGATWQVAEFWDASFEVTSGIWTLGAGVVLLTFAVAARRARRRPFVSILGGLTAGAVLVVGTLPALAIDYAGQEPGVGASLVAASGALFTLVWVWAAWSATGTVAVVLGVVAMALVAWVAARDTGTHDVSVAEPVKSSV